MFYHGYDNYMAKAYPADELMPLSCKGRHRDGIEPNRGHLDDALGNFSLTLIDTLDSLIILGDLDEFEHAMQLLIRDVTFDSDIVVSVFETNIRIVGGLLSGHVLAKHVQERYTGRLTWYKDELLAMAKDIGYRLLPAFNSSSGLPYPRVRSLRTITYFGTMHYRSLFFLIAGQFAPRYEVIKDCCGARYVHRLRGDNDIRVCRTESIDRHWRI